MRGFTMRHPDVPEELRGTYAGLAHPAAIQHLLDLGVTTVELMPIHQYVSETHLQHRGKANYWGYNSVAFFAPHARYAATGSRGQQVDEFKAMVKALHAAGLEVVLDVVYNHTGEEGPTGPTLSFRGIDNLAYYRQHAADPSQYYDYTGCGNTVDVSHPHVLRLVMDSLAVLGCRDARRRLPLRPRGGAGSVDGRRRHARLVHDGDRAGPRAARGQAHRRALGHRPGATRSASSRTCGPSGTTSSATRCATTGAVRPPAFVISPTGCPARPTSTATTDAARTRRSTS